VTLKAKRPSPSKKKRSTRCYDTDLNDAAWAWIARRAHGWWAGHLSFSCRPSNPSLLGSRST
jgi:hypothetical protein